MRKRVRAVAVGILAVVLMTAASQQKEIVHDVVLPRTTVVEAAVRKVPEELMPARVEVERADLFEEEPETEEIVVEDPPEIIKTLQPLTEEEVANWKYYGYIPGEGIRFPEIWNICLAMQEEYGICAAMMYALIEHESTFNPGVSNGSCIGLCQVSQRWHGERMAKLGVTDLWSMEGNIRVAADYISDLYKEAEEKGYGDDAYYVLMRYNMEIETANRLYESGKFSNYATDIMKEAGLIERAMENEV